MPTTREVRESDVMNKMRVFLILLVSASAHCSVGDSAYNSDEPRAESSFSLARIVPVGRIDVDVMDIVVPERAKELSERFRASIAEHGTWLRDYMNERGQVGQPLPYHPNMGLRKPEYEEFLQLSGKREFRRSASVQLDVTRTSHKTIRLDGGAALPALTGIEIDFASMRIETPLGTCGDYRMVGPAEYIQMLNLGNYECCQWICQMRDEDTNRSEFTSLMVGRLIPSARGFIYYNAGRAENLKRVFEGRVFVTFNCGDGN